MDHLQWFDYLRMITGLLALMSFVNVAKRYRKDVLQYTLRLEQMSMCFMAFLLLVVYGTIEQIIQDVPFGARSPLTLIVVAVTFRASLRKEPLVKEGYHG